MTHVEFDIYFMSWYILIRYCYNKYTNSFNSYNSVFKTNIHILACTCNSIKNITKKHLKVNCDHKNSNKIHQTHDYKIKRTSPGFDEFTLENSKAVHSRGENGFKKIMCVYKLTKTGMTKNTAWHWYTSLSWLYIRGTLTNMVCWIKSGWI